MNCEFLEQVGESKFYGVFEPHFFYFGTPCLFRSFQSTSFQGDHSDRCAEQQLYI